MHQMHKVTPVSGRVVAEVREEVVDQLPEDVQCDSAVRRADGLIGLTEHGVKGIDENMLRQHLVGESINVQQDFQLLQVRSAKSYCCVFKLLCKNLHETRHILGSSPCMLAHN